MYSFDRQLQVGELAETQLDEFFQKWYEILPATREQQRAGIDRIFSRRDNGKQYMVEYKTDFMASKTGNAFVETVSVDTAGKRGWAYTSQSDVLIYFVYEDSLIYIIMFSVLRVHLPRWALEYPKRTIPNKGYSTSGVLVPLREFEEISLEVISF